MTAFMPIPGIASYRASKQALRAFHHALALEERHGPVNFTILHPTSTQTLMLEQEAQHGASAFAFASEPVTAEFVAQTLFKAIKKNPLKCMPPEQARAIRMLGPTRKKCAISSTRWKKSANRRNRHGEPKLLTKQKAPITPTCRCYWGP
ncbi:hypothetical protein cym2001_41930 [Pseudomonas sp. CYM-20-01]|nr:hypothetical protein cym2001_41930 [Pseudomonas sp. CYM-20-01]